MAKQMSGETYTIFYRIKKSAAIVKIIFLALLWMIFAPVSAKSAPRALAINGIDESPSEAFNYSASLFADYLKKSYINDEKISDDKLHYFTEPTSALYSTYIKHAFQGSASNDTLVFFYSGHATREANGKRRYGIYTKEGGCFTFEDLYLELEKYPGNKIVILDCCHSGAFIAEIKSHINKYFVLTACDPSNYSIMFARKPNIFSKKKVSATFFTYHLLSGMGYDKKLRADTGVKDNVISSNEIFSYLQSHYQGWYEYPSATNKNKKESTFALPQTAGGFRPVFSNKATLSIKLNMGKTSIYPGEKISLKATVKGENKKVIWSSSNSRVASVSGKGKVTGIKAGTAIITAKAGSKSATCQVTVLDPNVRLSNENLTIIRGKTSLLKLTYGGPSQKVTWKSSNKKIATVNKKGIVTGKRAGKVTITVTVNKVKKTCVVTVKDPYVTISSKALSLTKGAKYKLSAATNGKSNKFTWKSSKSKVASIDKYGNVTAKRPGTAIITVKANGKQASCTVTVRALELKVSLDRTSLNLNVGSSSTLKATVTGGSGKVSWTTSNNKIATVSAGGSVKAIAEGKATITATIDGKKASCSVTVNKVTAKATDYRDVSNYLGQRLKQVAAGMKLKKVVGYYESSIAIYSVTGSQTGYNSIVGAYSYGVPDDSLWWFAVIKDQSFNIYGLRVGARPDTVLSTMINNGWKRDAKYVEPGSEVDVYSKGHNNMSVLYKNNKAVNFQIQSHTDIKHPG